MNVVLISGHLNIHIDIILHITYTLMNMLYLYLMIHERVCVLIMAVTRYSMNPTAQGVYMAFILFRVWMSSSQKYIEIFIVQWRSVFVN